MNLFGVNVAFYTGITGRILIIAPFPPRELAAARQAAELAYALDSAGFEVKTLSSTTPAYSDQFLHFFPKKRFQPHVGRIIAEKHGVCVVFPQALGFENIRQDRWKNRRIEEFRRLKFLALIAFRKPKTVIVHPTGVSLITRVACFSIAISARILRPNSVRLISKKNRGLLLAQRITGHKIEKPDSAAMEETLFRLANKTESIQLTPAWLRSAINRLPADTDLKADLQVLQSVVMHLLKKPAPFQHISPGFSDGDISDDIIDSPERIPVSQFMQHLNSKFKKNRRFNLAKPKERLDFLHWYMVHGPDKNQHPLPLNVLVFEAFKEDCKKRASFKRVVALGQPETNDVILPVYFLSLLHCYPQIYGKQNLEQNADRIAFAFQVITAHARFMTDIKFIGSSLATYFQAPVGGIKGNLSRFELLASVLAHAPAQTQNCLEAPWQCAGLADWFCKLGQRGYPLLGAFSSTGSSVRDLQIFITGTASKETGLDRNQKMSQQAIGNTSPEMPVYLHHVNADQIPAQVLGNTQKGAFHIGYLLWELEKTPKSHDLANRYLDEIWTPSKFVQRIYETAYNRPVTMIGKGFDLPDVQAVDMSDYGFDRSDTVFLMCFDIHSSVARKNPLAAITAFQQAFSCRKDVRFILKTTPAPQQHWGDPEGQMQIIERMARRDSRIVIDQRMLPFNDLLGLIRGADCIVSPHRSEGFGYFPAYALKYAKPLIVTDYSGTRDFCTTQTSYPVPCQMIKTKASAIISPVDGVYWAEIDQNALVDTLRRVYEDMPAATKRAKQGQDLMLDYYSADALAKRYRIRFDELGISANFLIKHSCNVPVSDGQGFQR